MYHRGVLPEVERAISLKLFKMKDLIASLRTLRWTAIPASHLVNINTPDQLSQLDEALVSPARGEDGDR